MLNIKKYANGRFFDTDAKKYIKPEKLAEIIENGEAIQVTLTKTGKDITDSVIKQFSEKKDQKKDKENKKTEIPFLKTDKIKKWLGEVVDTRIEKVMNAIKLPTREQVAKLDDNINQLNKNIDALVASQEKAAKKKAAAAKKATATKLKTAAISKPAVENKAATEDKKPALNKLNSEKKTETTPV